ncbi:MAG: amidohydrolase family protein [Nitrospirota bacterium]
MIIHADRLITRLDHAPLVAGAVVINHGRIHAVGTACAMMRKYPGHRIIRLAQAVIMPGLVNVHTHLELPLLLDDIRAQNYTDWVFNLLASKKHLTRRDYAAASQRNIEALIRSGTTTVAEISTHGVSPLVLRKSGLRSVVYHEIIFMGEDVSRLIFPGRGPVYRLVNYGISPHSPHTVSGPALRTIHHISSRRHLRLCMHVAETREETLLLQRKKNTLELLYAAAGWDLSGAPVARSSFAYLHRLGVLGPSFLAVHAVHVDNADIGIMKRSGSGVAHCPRSNHEIGVGTMQLRKLLDARISVGLGTDSLASVPSLNLWDEMRYAYQVHRRSGVTPQDIFHIATLGGAGALGMGREIGSLEPGKKADLIAISLPRKNTGDLYSDLLRETKTCTMSMVNGHVVFGGETDMNRLLNN